MIPAGYYMKLSLRSIPVTRVLKIAGGTVLTLLVLLALALAALPQLVSNASVQARVKKILATSMKRHVGWSHLAISWRNGLSISDLQLGEGAAPLLKTSVDQIDFIPAFARGADGHFGVDVTLKVRNVRAELAPGPAKPPPPPSDKDALTQLALTIQKLQGLDSALPIDVRLLIDIAPLSVRYRVPAPAKELELRNVALKLAMPSLASKPIVADIHGGIIVAGHQLGDVTLAATIRELVNKERRIHPAAALCDVAARLPGTSLTITGGLTQRDGVIARWLVDFPQLLAMAHPLLPATLPRVAGTLDVRLTGQVDNKQDLHAALTIAGRSLAAQGGLLHDKKVGPLDITVQQRLDADRVSQRIQFPGGKLSIPGVIEGAWQGAVMQPGKAERSTELSLTDVRLDLAGALRAAASFVPANSPLKELSGALSLRSLKLSLAGAAHNGSVTLNGLALALNNVAVALKKGELSASDVQLVVDDLTAPLAAKKPTALQADLHWQVGKGQLSGAQPLTVRGARGTFAVALHSLNLKSPSPRKVSAAVDLRQTCDVEYVSGGAAYTVEKIHDQLHLLARATDSGVVEGNLPEFVLTVGAAKGLAGGKKFGPLPLSASLTLADLLLPAAGGKPTVRHAAARISAGDFLQLAADAVLGASTASTGTARLDLHQAQPFLAPFVPPDLKSGGVVSASWDVAMPLVHTPAVPITKPLQKLKHDVARLDKADVRITLENVSASVPSGKNKILISGLNSAPELHLSVVNKGAALRFDGGLQLAALSGLPGSAAKLPSQHGSLLVSGELSDWKTLRFSEELRVDPLTIRQDAELTVNRIDSLLDEAQPYTPAALVKRLDATLFATFAGQFTKELTPLLPGVQLAGSASTGLRVDLTAGKELALRYNLKTDDFGVQLANGTVVEGMRSDIAIQRSYALVTAGKADRWTPLSAALVRPLPVKSGNSGAEELIGRIHDDLRGDVRGSRSFFIRRVVSKGASGVPLVLTALEGDLLLTQEQAGISFFQGDLLGGTLLARTVFDLRPEVPVLSAGSSFSNLDVSLLLPADARQRQGRKDAEITGEMTLAAPLTPEQRELFEQLRMAVHVRKIGADTIERALFSLDPYERNEQVVGQRKMLRLGGLKSLRATAVDGAFGMEGEAHIKGVVVELPKVERMRISELPMRQELVQNRKNIISLRNALDLVRADTLLIDPKGKVTIERRKHVQ